MKNTEINKKVIKHHQKGIALVTTIILTSIMLSSIVVVTKEMVDEARNAIRINNSLIAYYAAEAGIEDALLEFRYDHSAQISSNPSTVDVACTPPDNYGCTPRTRNIDTDAIEYPTTKAPNVPYYDVLMWNRVKSILNQKILKDDVAEFVVPNMTAPVTLVWAKNPNTPPGNGYRVEITVYDEDGNIIPPEGMADSLGRTGGKYFSKPIIETSYTIPTSVVGAGNKKIIIRIKPAYTKATQEPDGSYTEGGVIPNDIPYISLNINQTPTADFIAGTTTKIESVGYYGGVARKISATVDRPSGNILNIFDYVIYSASNLIK